MYDPTRLPITEATISSSSSSDRWTNIDRWTPGVAAFIFISLGESGTMGTCIVSLQQRVMKKDGSYSQWIDIKEWAADTSERIEYRGGEYRIGVKGSNWTAGTIYFSVRTEVLG